MTVLSAVPHCHTIRCKGVVLGQRSLVLVDGGATHNSIDEYILEKRNITIEKFDGFAIVLANADLKLKLKWISII